MSITFTDLQFHHNEYTDTFMDDSHNDALDSIELNLYKDTDISTARAGFTDVNSNSISNSNVDSYSDFVSSSSSSSTSSLKSFEMDTLDTVSDFNYSAVAAFDHLSPAIDKSSFEFQPHFAFTTSLTTNSISITNTELIADCECENPHHHIHHHHSHTTPLKFPYTKIEDKPKTVNLNELSLKPKLSGSNAAAESKRSYEDIFNLYTSGFIQNSRSRSESLDPQMITQTMTTTCTFTSTSASTPAHKSTLSTPTVTLSPFATDGEDKHIYNLSTESAVTKKVSDSRLSLVQLAVVLGLKDNVEEAANREKLILDVFKSDLGFPLGEKTWIRDTPLKERQYLIEQLQLISESKYNFGYPKSIYGTIIRRASYYMMQGRLRRERRTERKLKARGIQIS